MKKLILLASLAFMTPNIANAQRADDKKNTFQLTLCPPVGTQGADASQYTNDISLNLLWGKSKNENYLAIGGLANIVENNVKGLQWAGLANVTGNNATGAQWAGLANVTGNQVKGLQIAGLANVTGNNATGAQWAGLVNVSGGNVFGLQIAGLANVSPSFAGAQFAGIMNVTSQVQGLQMAGIGNFASNVKGAQIGGVFNKATNVSGVQFAALVNIADNSDYPVGLVNIIRNGEMGIALTYNETGSAVASFRSGGRVMYGIVGAGYNHRALSKESFLVQAGIGAHINITERFRVNTEATASTMGLFRDEMETTQYSLAILPAFKVTPKFEIFLGPSVSYLTTDNMDNTKLFPSDTSISLWKSFGGSRLEEVYAGFTVGTHFIF